MAELDLVIGEFQDSELPDLMTRDIDLPEIAKKPTVIIGTRRTGSTPAACIKSMRQIVAQ